MRITRKGKRELLVLKRKPNESVVLNGVIKIYVLGIEHDRVKLGFEAPPDVQIVRSELLDDASHDPVPVPPKAGESGG